jgi:hypothetical protein
MKNPLDAGKGLESLAFTTKVGIARICHRPHCITFTVLLTIDARLVNITDDPRYHDARERSTHAKKVQIPVLGPADPMLPRLQSN